MIVQLTDPSDKETAEPVRIDWPAGLPIPMVGDTISAPYGEAHPTSAKVVIERIIHLDPKPPQIVLVVNDA